MTKDKIIKNREITEKKILEAVGELIKEEGFEKIGVNAVAQKAGISKMLIYRYFGSIEELIFKYILQKDYWINISTESFMVNNIGVFLKNIFRKQISQLREDITLKRLYRWELSTDNPIINQLRNKRESNGCHLIDTVSQLTNSPQKEIASLATILSASISYLVLLEELNPIYNSIDLQSDEGWEQISQGIDQIIDLWIQNKK